MFPAKFMNDTASFVTDALRGTAAMTQDLEWVPDPGYLIRSGVRPTGQVALVSGGGTGHEPLHAGMIGAGMLTAAAPGLIFSSPNAIQIHAATMAADNGSGVLHIVKNYTGDAMNFAIAADLARGEGVQVETVLVDDDVATDADGVGPGRRGTAAALVTEKICGAAADRNWSLADIAALGRQVVARSRSMAVALRAPTLPGQSRPSFDLPAGQMELGIGIHGERGTTRTPILPSAAIAESLIAPVMDALRLAPGNEVIVVVNGLGAAHPLELSVLFADLVDVLETSGVRIRRTLVGTFVTALDMAGASVTLTRCDDRILGLWDHPTSAPAWPNAPTGEYRGIAKERRPSLTLRVPAPGTDQDPERPPALDPARELDHAAVTRWLTAFASRVVEEEPALTELDRQAGDGDFGATQLAALRGITDLTATGHRSVAPVFTLLSESYLARAGGTSGALFGMFFREFARSAARERVDGLTRTGLTSAVRHGYQTICRLGGASPGDRTMLDALAPALEQLEKGSADHTPLPEVLLAAARAAADGAASTSTMTARRGRASYLGEAATGVVDPGALVIAWFFEAAARSAQEGGATVE